MGRPIVYCEGCGNSLREADFEKGKAHEVENRPYCTDCKPLPAGTPKSHQKIVVPSRTPAPPPPSSRKKATGSIPLVTQPGTRRQAPAAKSGNLPLVIGGVIAAVIFLILIIAVAASRNRQRPPAPSDPPKQSSFPSEPSPVSATPASEPRRAGPSSRRDENPRTETPMDVPDASARLDTFLAQIRKMIHEDAGFQRKDEVLSMLAAAAKGAGTRAAEVERIRNEYLKAGAGVAGGMRWSDWKISSDPVGGAAAKQVASYENRTNVYVTHPFAKDRPATLERDFEVPAGKLTSLSLWVAPMKEGDWELRIFASGQELKRQPVGPPGSGWKLVWVDLSPLAGKKVTLRLENAATNWSCEHGWWSDIEVRSQ